MKKLIPILLVVAVISCQKAQRDEDTATNTAEDISLAQTIFSDAYKLMREAALNTAGISNSTGSISTIFGCEDVLVDTLSDPKKITLDFKYIGCQGLDQDRYGRLIGEFYGEFPVENSALDLTFSNYYFGDYEVNGKVRVIFKGDNAEGNAINTFYVQSGSLASRYGNLTWVASQAWETVDGSPDPTEFMISGRSNGVNKKGNVFFSEILTPMNMNDECISVLSGKQEVEVLNLSNRIITYESNSCVNSGICTINGSRYPFTY